MNKAHNECIAYRDKCSRDEIRRRRNKNEIVIKVMMIDS